MSANHDGEAQYESGQRGAAALGGEFLAHQAHDKGAQHQADDLRPDILDDLRPVHTYAAGDIPQEAGDAEAHVFRVAKGHQRHGDDAHHQPGQNDQAMLFDEVHAYDTSIKMNDCVRLFRQLHHSGDRG